MRFQRLATVGLAVLLGLLPGALAAAAPAPQSVALPTDWKVGEKLRLEVVKERVDSARGKETTHSTSRGIVEAVVRARNEQGFVFVWRYSAGWIDEIAADRLPVSTERLNEVAAGLDLVMQTDPAGVPQALLNRDEAVGVVKRVLDEVLKEKKSELAPAVQMSEAIAILTKPEVVETVMLRSAQVFYFLCGVSLTVGKTVEYTDLLPNPFGGDPFPSKGRFVLQEVRPGPNEAVLTWRQEIDREKASAAIAAIVRRLMPDAGPEETPTLDVRDQATYTIDTKTGWPRSVEWSRTISAGELMRTERVTIKTLEGR